MSTRAGKLPLPWLRALFVTLVIRDLRLRYKRSLLGAAWSILNPLAYLLVLDLVFGHLMRLEVPRYTSFLFTGLLAWGWFSSSLGWAASTIIDHRDLVMQPGVPPTVLIPVRVASDLVHFLIALPVLFIFLFVDGSRPTASWLALPLLIGLQFLLTLGPAWALSALHVRFRDTQYLLGIALHLTFFLTPIFYDVGAVPEGYRRLLGLNPLAALLDSYRAVLVGGTWPHADALLLVSATAAVGLLFGYWIFARASSTFSEEV